jgi:hypothetical protein
VKKEHHFGAKIVPKYTFLVHCLSPTVNRKIKQNVCGRHEQSGDDPEGGDDPT